MATRGPVPIEVSLGTAPGKVPSRMSAPLSVLIPTLHVGAGILPTLAALAASMDEGLIREVILADGGSADDIAAIADATGARLVVSPPGRGVQLAAAARVAQGEWLLVLHADTVPAAGWIPALRHHVLRHPGMAGYFRLAFDATGPWPPVVAGWANLRARVFGLPYGDQGLLIPRALYDRVGGYPEIALMEDVVIARRLSGALRAIPARVVTSAARYERDGWLRRGLRNWATLLRFALGTGPDTLARSYGRERRG